MRGEYLLALNAHPRIGSQTLKKMLAVFVTGENIWKANEKELRERLGDKIAKLAIEARKLTTPEKELEKLAKSDIGYITIYDKNYPQMLKEIHDAPVILYVKGQIDALNSVSIAIVGSRKYSEYGKRVCAELSSDCVKGGLTIISGLALGIDAFAHQTAVDQKGCTVGVLGCGLNQIYPVSNHNLGIKMLESGGAIISEFPPETPPLKQNFPARNRIIAGLSLGVLVIEAAEKSGALITAYQALEYNREVMAVPGNIDVESSIGTNKLIKEGASLVSGAKDIFEVLRLENKNLEKLIIEAPENCEEETIIELLKSGDKTVNEIVKETGINVVALSAALTTLEMKKLILNTAGRYHLNFRKSKK